jgi:hypothetical protein
MPTTRDEAGAALALVTRLAMEWAARGEKEMMLNVLTVCMDGLLKIHRQGSAAILQLLHAEILAAFPEDDDQAGKRSP